MRFIGHDLRYSIRLLLKSPGFTIVAIITLALGIAANSIVFSVMNALVLHPLNLPEADRLYQIDRGKDKWGLHSYPDYVDMRDRSHSFYQLVAAAGGPVAINTGGNPEKAWVLMVSGNYFDGLRVEPYLGRFFHDSDEHGANSAPYIVLTYGYWHTHFHDDPGVVGRVVQLNKYPYTILGVAAPDFHGTLVYFFPDFMIPMVNQEQIEGKSQLNDRGSRWVFWVLGALKEGVTKAQAVTDLNAIGADLEKSYPKEDDDMKFSLSHPALLGDSLERPVKMFLAVLMVLAGLILVAACTNLGSLFAARAADRSKEVALRLALGSTRRRVLRQLFTEAMVISIIGGAVGVSVSVILLTSLSTWQPMGNWPLHLQVRPDANVYGFALLLAVASGIIFAAVPLRQILRTDPYQVIKSGPSGKTGRRLTFRDVLLAGQIAICAVLVTSSLVAVRGLVRSVNSNFGFEPQNAILANTDLSMAGYRGDQVPVMQKRMLSAVAPIPGVDSVALIYPVPLSPGAIRSLAFTDQTTDLKEGNAAARPYLYRVSPDYFRAAGTPLVSGRGFTWHDDKDAPLVAVVNPEFAHKVFGSVSGALDQYFKTDSGKRIQVVGIAEQGKYNFLTEDPKPVMFLPLLQSRSTETWMVVRSSRDSQLLAPDIRNTLRELDANLPIYTRPWIQEMDRALFAPRVATYSLGVLGAIAAMLCITGIFGVAAYTVSKRMRQLGIRVALGAQRRQVLQTALGRAVILLGLGSVAGLALGMVASRVLAFVVYQATSRDPMVLLGAILAMFLLGLLATWIPAQRALSADPSVLLREE